jgi:hypothetical protein
LSGQYLLSNKIDTLFFITPHEQKTYLKSVRACVALINMVTVWWSDHAVGMAHRFGAAILYTKKANPSTHYQAKVRERFLVAQSFPSDAIRNHGMSSRACSAPLSITWQNLTSSEEPLKEELLGFPKVNSVFITWLTVTKQ